MSPAERMTAADVIALGRRWIASGVPAFPIKIRWDATKGTTNKNPLTNHGHLDATLDPATFERLVNARSPKPGEAWGVGLHPGPAGYAVVDIDTHPGGPRGDDTWATLEATNGKVDTYTATTPSGGQHLWGDKGDRRIGNAHELGPGIDLRGDDGWVVAPGTRSPWGAWEADEATPWPPAPWPKWVIDHITATGANDGDRAGHWRQVDRAALHPADAAALIALERLGGHDPYLSGRNGDSHVMITRPGSSSAGASIGYIAPGVVKVWHQGWWPLHQEGRYNADHLAAIADAVDAGDRQYAEQLADPADMTWAGATSDNPDTSSDTAEVHVPSAVTLTAASTVSIDRPYWVWENRIPVGGTTLMPGREGMGKTALVCWLMARLTRGQLPGHRFGKPAHVIYVGHEDDRASVLVPRLTAAGADLDRVLFVDMPNGASFSVSVDTVALRDAVAGLDVALITIDPLDGHLVGVDTHRKAEVQQSILKLAVLAQELRCGALGLAHLNKGDVRDLLARVNGSAGFTTSVRSVLGVGEHPDDPAERVCVVAKANMTDKTKVPAIRFRVEGASIEHPDGGLPIDTGVAVMLGEQEGIDPNDVIDSGSPAEKSAVEEASDWLADVLAEGPQSSKDVKAWAKAADISERTLKRALSRAGVEVSRLNTERGRPTVWALRGFRAKGFGPTPPGPKPTRASTSENAASDGGFGPSTGNGPKPPHEPALSVVPTPAYDPLDEDF